MARTQLERRKDNPDEHVSAWGREVLDGRRRSEAGFVLKNRAQVLVLPRPSGPLREEIRYAWPWDAEMQPDTIAEPSCRLPHAPGPLPAPSPELGLLLFEASPVRPMQPLKGVAATRFRLAPVASPTGTDPQAYAGRLRPARAIPRSPDSMQPEEMFAYTVAEDVSFVATSVDRYPMPADYVAHQRRVPDGSPLSPEKESPSQALLPPLIDVVSWAARPGESVRSAWSLEQLSYQSAGGVTPTTRQLAVGPASAVQLRRPRATPGANEAVRLEPVGRAVLASSRRFIERTFRLHQVIEVTKFGPGESVYAVVATKSEFFRSSKEAALARTNPARLYHHASSPAPALALVPTVDIDSFEIVLVANNPDDFKKETGTNAAGQPVTTRVVSVCRKKEKPWK